MKKNILKMTPIFLIGLTAFASSCTDKKKEDENTTPDTKTLLTSGDWYTVSIAYKKYNTDIDSVTVAAEPCEQDDKTLFTTTGSIIEDQGAVKCDAEDPQTEVLTYTLADKTINVSVPDLPGVALIWEILEISDTKLVLKNTFLGETEIYTYKKK